MSNEIYDKGFVTGESYQIKDIFSDDRKIVIPDLQRDYCWGQKTKKKQIEFGNSSIAIINSFLNFLIQ